uniref:Uncharacterized protein n=1 Tax=Mucochytrium quahogii TaxID=96639 RepID=A0A7S2RDK5_9STRA
MGRVTRRKGSSSRPQDGEKDVDTRSQGTRHTGPDVSLKNTLESKDKQDLNNIAPDNNSEASEDDEPPEQVNAHTYKNSEEGEYITRVQLKSHCSEGTQDNENGGALFNVLTDNSSEEGEDDDNTRAERGEDHEIRQAVTDNSSEEEEDDDITQTGGKEGHEDRLVGTDNSSEEEEDDDNAQAKEKENIDDKQRLTDNSSMGGKDDKSSQEKVQEDSQKQDILLTSNNSEGVGLTNQTDDRTKEGETDAKQLEQGDNENINGGGAYVVQTRLDVTTDNSSEEGEDDDESNIKQASINKQTCSTFTQEEDDAYQTDNSSEADEDDIREAEEDSNLQQGVVQNSHIDCTEQNEDTHNSSEEEEDDVIKHNSQVPTNGAGSEDGYTEPEDDSEPETPICTVNKPPRRPLRPNPYQSSFKNHDAYGITFSERPNIVQGGCNSLYTKGRYRETTIEEEEEVVETKTVVTTKRVHAKKKVKDKQHHKPKKPGRKVKPESDFISRMDQLAEQKHRKRQDAIDRKAYEENLRKKVCPQCGVTQSFDQVKKRQKKCIDCKKNFRHPLVWNSVRDGFMKRHNISSSTSTIRLEEIHDPPQPPPHSRVNKDFLARMDAAAERRKTRSWLREKEEKSRQAKAKVKKKSSKPWNPTQPSMNYTLHTNGKANVLPCDDNNMVFKNIIQPDTAPSTSDPTYWQARKLVSAHIFRK